MKNRKIFALAISFLVLGNNCQQLKADPPKITTHQTNDEVYEARKTIAYCEPLLVFELCDIFKSFITFVDNHETEIVGAIQSEAVNDITKSYSTVALKTIFTAFSGYYDQLDMLGRSDTISVSDLQRCFADVSQYVYPSAEEYPGKYDHAFSAIIDTYIPKEDENGEPNVIFSVTNLNLFREEFYEALENLQQEIKKYFNEQHHSIEEVRRKITPTYLGKLKFNLNHKLTVAEQRQLNTCEQDLKLLNQVSTTFSTIDEIFKQPTLGGKIWCGIKSLFGY